MEKKVTFILSLHNHQPVGNFDHILEEAYCKAYYPFLEVLHDYPDIPFALHNSGVLWDWLLEKHPEYLELLTEMIEVGQVEIMSGGYYEPILSVIPERDCRGQLDMMRDFLNRRFKITPRGCWLTERIWAPHLPKTLAGDGLEYVVVDDAHFKSTGFRSPEMRGFFMTEEDGKYVKVFPIDKKLRYLIPFSDPEETISYFREIAGERGEGCKVAVLADDGEKFGLWTGTHDLCYEDNWLRRFCESILSNRDWLEVSTFSRAIDDFSPIGIVYLPTASYSEMMEWALPLPAQERYEEAEGLIASSGTFDEPAEMVRGGFWRNFLVKYEESNWMHKRMLLVSELVEKYGRDAGSDGVWKEARNHLYKAQCNCAYWHGLFGGLYLPHLRSAVFKHLVAAESLIEKKISHSKHFIDYYERDIDGDGVTEVVLSSHSMKAIFKLRGAALRELDLREPAFNLTDTLTRREEIYHRRLDSITVGTKGGAEEALSIHNVSSVKEKGLDKRLVFDFHLRSSLLDHFIGGEVDLESFSRARYIERGDFLRGTYKLDVRKTAGKTLFVFERQGKVDLAGQAATVSVSKSFCLSPSSSEIEVHYAIKSVRGILDCRFASESVFSLLAGKAPDRFFRFPDREVGDIYLESKGEEESVGSFCIVDEWLNIEICLRLEPSALLWRFPIETISNSDSGFERIYQGSAVVPVWPLDPGEGKVSEFSIYITVKKALDHGGVLPY